MKIEKFSLSYLKTNCYLIENPKKKELVIVDPAICPEYLVEHVESIRYTPKAILLTHGHFDHVMGIDAWVDTFQIPVYLYEDEAEVLADASLNLSTMLHTEYTYRDVHGLKDGEEIELAGIKFRVIHTPGHTKGSCCYYIEDEGILLSGDTLFCRSVGRSDFPTGDMDTLVHSIHERLFVLPDSVKVYPGHELETCIGDEKRLNPFA